MKHKTALYLYWHKGQTGEDGVPVFTPYVATWTMESDEQWVFIRKEEVTLTFPDADFREMALETIRGHRKKAMADHQLLMTRLKGEEQNLLALSYESVKNGDSGGTGEETDHLVDDTRDDHFP